MQTLTIKYIFTLSDNSKKVFNLQLDSQNLCLIENTPEILPPWTKLGFHQCPNCPLTTNTHLYCPMATNLVYIINRLECLISYDEIHVEVITKERIISQKTTAQRGISSLIGLISATCGCPHTVFFKPMARFHLPFATEEETIYRSTSMWLLAQYFLKKADQTVDFEFKKLSKIYNNIQIINTAIAERLRAATEADSAVNGVIMLDMYAQTIPFAVEKYLDEIRYLFSPFI
ncbi:DUF6901 family protein [Candidatus Latescibacterota bacterium]